MIPTPTLDLQCFKKNLSPLRVRGCSFQRKYQKYASFRGVFFGKMRAGIHECLICFDFRSTKISKIGLEYNSQVLTTETTGRKP